MGATVAREGLGSARRPSRSPMSSKRVPRRRRVHVLGQRLTGRIEGCERPGGSACREAREAAARERRSGSCAAVESCAGTARRAAAPRHRNPPAGARRVADVSYVRPRAQNRSLRIREIAARQEAGSSATGGTLRVEHRRRSATPELRALIEAVVSPGGRRPTCRRTRRALCSAARGVSVEGDDSRDNDRAGEAARARER